MALPVGGGLDLIRGPRPGQRQLRRRRSRLARLLLLRRLLRQQWLGSPTHTGLRRTHGPVLLWCCSVECRPATVLLLRHRTLYVAACVLRRWMLLLRRLAPYSCVLMLLLCRSAAAVRL